MNSYTRKSTQQRELLIVASAVFGLLWRAAQVVGYSYLLWHAMGPGLEAHTWAMLAVLLTPGAVASGVMCFWYDLRSRHRRNQASPAHGIYQVRVLVSALAGLIPMVGFGLLAMANHL